MEYKIPLRRDTTRLCRNGCSGHRNSLTLLSRLVASLEIFGANCGTWGALLIIVGLLFFLMGVIGDLIATNRKLLERIDMRLKQLDYRKNLIESLCK